MLRSCDATRIWLDCVAAKRVDDWANCSTALWFKSVAGNTCLNDKIYSIEFMYYLKTRLQACPVLYVFFIRSEASFAFALCVCLLAINVGITWLFCAAIMVLILLYSLLWLMQLGVDVDLLLYVVQCENHLWLGVYSIFIQTSLINFFLKIKITPVWVKPALSWHAHVRSTTAICLPLWLLCSSALNSHAPLTVLV